VTKRQRCRHECNSWFLGVTWQWCYRCGALRQVTRTFWGADETLAYSGWQRPVGADGDNPGRPPERRKVKR
jgi:hypothetical protein